MDSRLVHLPQSNMDPYSMDSSVDMQISDSITTLLSTPLMNILPRKRLSKHRVSPVMVNHRMKTSPGISDKKVDSITISSSPSISHSRKINPANLQILPIYFSHSYLQYSYLYEDAVMDEQNGLALFSQFS